MSVLHARRCVVSVSVYMDMDMDMDELPANVTQRASHCPRRFCSVPSEAFLVFLSNRRVDLVFDRVV